MERPAAGHVVEVSILIKQSILSLSTQLSNCFSMFILVSSRGGWGGGGEDTILCGGNPPVRHPFL